MKRLSGGIDVGSERHHVIIMDDKEKILYDREIAQKYSDFHEALEYDIPVNYYKLDNLVRLTLNSK